MPIDPELWDIEVDVCGEVEGFDIKWLEGRVINPTDELSPYYDVAYTVTYEDGTVAASDGNTIIDPIPPGGSGDFSVTLLEGAGRTVATCEVIVTDAVENYN